MLPRVFSFQARTLFLSGARRPDRKSTRLNSSHANISYAVFCLKKFVSRYADPEGNGGFLDHFYRTATLDGNKLAFTTEVVQGVSFVFFLTVKRGEGSSSPSQAYYMLS